ncbi:MAG TPA: cobalamin biosynthesis protein, partial [Gemmatales bacterium]|nr:cobalamin biosynthesis protein [Gemmatales bacterium]
QDWWLLWGGLPSCCTPVTEIPAEGEADALILITDRLYPLPPELGGSALIYRPPSLALGVATCRGVDSADFAAQVGLALLRAGLSENSLAAVGIAAVRRSDAALIDFTDDRELPLLPYPMEKLGLVHQVIGRRPRRQAGTAAAAALLAAGTQQLLMPPTLAGRAVLAVARRPLA